MFDKLKPKQHSKPKNLFEVYSRLQTSNSNVVRMFYRLNGLRNLPTWGERFRALYALSYFGVQFIFRILMRNRHAQRRAREIESILPKKSEHPVIVFYVMGGIGDNLQMGPVATALKRSFPKAFLTMWGTRPDMQEYWSAHKSVDLSIFDKREDVRDAATNLLRRRNAVDLTYDYRYAIKPTFSRNARFEPSFIKSAQEAFQKHKPINFEIFPLKNNVMSRQIISRDEGIFDLIEASSTIPVRPLDFGIQLESRHFEKIHEAIEDQTYVTIHMGSDPILGGLNGKQTKNWFSEDWEHVISKLPPDYKVYQIGTPDEVSLKGADCRFKGALTLLESAALLSRARLHLDTEGGMVHLARAVNTKSIVLFGPTPATFFSYSGNISIASPFCGGCWWTTPDWNSNCALGYNEPACMRSIKPEIVSAEILRFLSAASDSETIHLSDLKSKEMPQPNVNC